MISHPYCQENIPCPLPLLSGPQATYSPAPQWIGPEDRKMQGVRGQLAESQPGMVAHKRKDA